MTKPKERPILFSGPMVRAILNGQKTQTRRLVKPMPGMQSKWLSPYVINKIKEGLLRHSDSGFGWQMYHPVEGTSVGWIGSPYGKPGDRLWVRETWQAVHTYIDPETRYADEVHTPETIPKSDDNGWWGVAYAATDPEADYHKEDRGFSWRPSIHMPRWASRITLEITDVRVERLQGISEEDAIAEGVTKVRDSCYGVPGFDYDDAGLCHTSPITPFSKLWESINGSGSWDANPWVWVIEFNRVAR